VLTAGVDLAAEPRGTAVAVLAWERGSARLIRLQTGVDDDAIVGVAADVDRLGVDCALGWPDPFVRFVTAHADGTARLGPELDGGMDWRRTLAHRATDVAARERTGRWPLSVSTDRLGLTAMRCAALVARLAAAGHDVDRSGSGFLAEVYPGASLRLWGFDTTGYRVGRQVRAALLARLGDACPWLDLDGHEEAMTASCDAFDAVVASLATRAVALGRADEAPAELLDVARREGWIRLPTCAMADLVR
jgi:predicted nuclease with RNAse H fold